MKEQIKIPLHKVTMSDTASQAVTDVLKSGFIGEGELVPIFEKQLSDFFDNGNTQTIAVNSCTSALHLAIYKMERYVGQNEILTTPLSCMATHTPIVLNGYKIKWVDVDPKTFNMDLDDLKRKLSPATRAVVVVHWGGNPIDLDVLRKTCLDASYFFNNGPATIDIIEDCAHAFGATYKGVRIGSVNQNRIVNTCVFSFGPIKIPTCGDGGLIAIKDLGLLNEVNLKRLRWYGIDRRHRDANVRKVGFKFHMNNISASIGIENLKTAMDHIEIRRKNARHLRKELGDVSGLVFAGENNFSESSRYLFTVLVERREDFIKKLAEAGIESGPVHKRTDKQPCFSDFKSFLPGMDFIEDKMTCIPCGSWLSEDDIDYIIETIKGGW